MKRTFLSLIVAVAVAAAAIPASAGASPGSGGSRVIPLGTAVHQGRLVQGFALIHGRAAAVKPAKPSKTDTLYTLLARGAKWRSIEDYVVNPGNGDGASGQLVTDAVTTAASTWEAEVTSGIFGTGTATGDPLAADWASPDGVNEVYFSDTELDARTVAVTIVWGVFLGAPSARELVEWDMVFNDALPEPWGDATIESGTWDVLNIATHEVGHSAGLGDLYTTAAAAQTMYGYASPGETHKRTLESGDIAGIRTLYP